MPKEKAYVGSQPYRDFDFRSDMVRLGLLHLWSYATGGYVVSSPAVANGVVYAASGDGKVYAFGLK